jgi:hypothetical protein
MQTRKWENVCALANTVNSGRKTNIWLVGFCFHYARVCPRLASQRTRMKELKCECLFNFFNFLSSSTRPFCLQLSLFTKCMEKFFVSLFESLRKAFKEWKWRKLRVKIDEKRVFKKLSMSFQRVKFKWEIYKKKLLKIHSNL